MDVKEFFNTGAALNTITYARRGGPQADRGGELRARYEHFEVGPSEGRFGMLGEIVSTALIHHDLVFEIDFGSHSISAARYRGEVVDGRKQYRYEWINPPSDADLVALTFVFGSLDFNFS